MPAVQMGVEDAELFELEAKVRSIRRELDEAVDEDGSGQ
jgi:hypothetical protein